MWDAVIRLTLRRLLDGVDRRGGVVEVMRVLFVDDERDLVSSLSRYFRLHGFETAGAFGVAEAGPPLPEAPPPGQRFHPGGAHPRPPGGGRVPPPRGGRRGCAPPPPAGVPPLR